ncbi:hypothetical protein KKB40_03855 [Patescibacteria group bacterium]|nr:hypothetical protein [Patescibacteria group bacterium]
MKPSERKQKLVVELTSLYEKLDVGRLYGFPNQKDTQQWLADVASVLKNLDESDYQEIVRLSKTVGLSQSREERKKAAQEINQFLSRKVAEWQRYDFSGLDNEKNPPKLLFGEPGKLGQPGGGGSIFIQAENFTMNGGGRITADGGDYIVHQNELNNYGTINQTIAETINNITKLTHAVGQSTLDETEKRQLIGDIETIKAQIFKPKPDKTILQRAWDAVQIASTIGGAAQLLGMIDIVVLSLLK